MPKSTPPSQTRHAYSGLTPKMASVLAVTDCTSAFLNRGLNPDECLLAARSLLASLVSVEHKLSAARRLQLEAEIDAAVAKATT